MLLHIKEIYKYLRHVIIFTKVSGGGIHIFYLNILYNKIILTKEVVLINVNIMKNCIT